MKIAAVGLFKYVLSMDKRPTLNKKISIQDFKDFYWLKEELIAFCKMEGLQRTGSKLEIAARIVYYLKTGKELAATTIHQSKQSTFDWSQAQLEVTTVITDNYKNTENVRQFFITQIGKHFKFNVAFMNWMKSNVGKTLLEATQAWEEIRQIKKSTKTPKDIAPQFEYNRYLRDFLADNPGKNRSVGIKLWKLKKAERGNNKYIKSDLKWLDN